MKGITREQAQVAHDECYDALLAIGGHLKKVVTSPFFKARNFKKALDAFNTFNGSLTPERLHVLGMMIFTHQETGGVGEPPELSAALGLYAEFKPELVQQINKRVRESLAVLPQDKQDHFYNEIEELKNVKTS